jgi:FMN reductase
MSLRVVGLGGSLAERSTSLAALRIALSGAVEAGAETRLFDVKSLDLPMYRPQETNVPDRVWDFCEAFYGAQGLLWSSPLYHGTVSGAFKNALDWLHLLINRDPPYLADKVIGLISTAGGVHGLQAVNTMEFAVRALRGWAVPMVLPIPRASQEFDAQDQPKDPSLAAQLRGLGREVVRAARQMAMVGYCDYSLPHPEAALSGAATRPARPPQVQGDA